MDKKQKEIARIEAIKEKQKPASLFLRRLTANEKLASELKERVRQLEIETARQAKERKCSSTLWKRITKCLVKDEPSRN